MLAAALLRRCASGLKGGATGAAIAEAQVSSIGCQQASRKTPRETVVTCAVQQCWLFRRSRPDKPQVHRSDGSPPRHRCVHVSGRFSQRRANAADNGY